MGASQRQVADLAFPFTFLATFRQQEDFLDRSADRDGGSDFEYAGHRKPRPNPLVHFCTYARTDPFYCRLRQLLTPFPSTSIRLHHIRIVKIPIPEPRPLFHQNKQVF